MRRIFAIAISLALLVVTAGLATAEPSSGPGNAQQAVNYVITRALSQRGVPYTYGGGNVAGPSRRPDPRPVTAPAPAPAQTPGLLFPPTGTSPLASTNPAATVDPTANTVGFDASGLIVYAFAGAGIKMPRSSGEQYKVGRKILPSQALPGDLIFYGPDGTQSVALFTGNGQMVEATDPVVTVSPVRTNGMTPYLTRIIG
jgi:cell wall-associated NlpC family hydrolase